MSPDTTIRTHLKPGDVGAIIHLHGKLYATEYGFDATFEPYVAIPLSEFALSHTGRERIWVVEENSDFRGSVAIVMHSETEAQLRWLILHPSLRCIGLGKKLVSEAVSFCKEAGYQSIFLWTVKGLESATNIYKAQGFSLTDSKFHTIWGVDLVEERYELTL